MKLIIATANPGKFVEFQEALQSSTLAILSAGDLGITTFPEETGSSYEENALMKAAHVALKTGFPALGDDSGLEVDALDGEPGLYSARYGGKLSNGERLAHLLSKLRHMPKAERSAKFVCSLVLANPAGEFQTFWGECQGQILTGPRGEQGFGYDPVFYSPELNKTFAEASESEKRAVSHRGRALEQFAQWLMTSKAKRFLENRIPKKED